MFDCCQLVYFTITPEQKMSAGRGHRVFGGRYYAAGLFVHPKPIHQSCTVIEKLTLEVIIYRLISIRQNKMHERVFVVDDHLKPKSGVWFACHCSTPQSVVKTHSLDVRELRDGVRLQTESGPLTIPHVQTGLTNEISEAPRVAVCRAIIDVVLEYPLAIETVTSI